jgi:DNA-binding transcriptional ArsR family regulator
MSTPEGGRAAVPLVTLFGASGRAKLLSVFATQRHREFNVTELAREAGVARKTAYDHIDDFVELGIVTEREAARGTRYAVDPDSDVARALYELTGAVLRRELELARGIELPDDGVDIDDMQ